MNRIYQVIFNRTRGMYQVVSEIVKRSGKDKNSRSRNRELRLMVALSLCLMGIAGGTSASYAAGPNENNPALEQRI